MKPLKGGGEPVFLQSLPDAVQAAASGLRGPRPGPDPPVQRISFNIFMSYCPTNLEKHLQTELRHLQF